MKSIFNLSKGILSVALISVAFASCSEDTMDNINKDKDHTTSVPAKFILADVITATAFSNIGGDFNTYYSTYVEHMVEWITNWQMRRNVTESPRHPLLLTMMGQFILYIEECTYRY